MQSQWFRRPALVLLAAFALLASAQLAPAAAADAKDKEAAKKLDGDWKWTTPGRNGGEGYESKLTLRHEGEKLTGVLVGRNARETKIEDAKFADGTLSFTVNREYNGRTMAIKFHGKLEGDTIKGKSESAGRDGETRSRDWEAKRDTEKKDKDKA